MMEKYKNKKLYLGDGCSFVPEKSHVEMPMVCEGSDIAKAEEAVCERGNKLSEMEEKTESMTNDAKVSFSLLNFSTCRIFPGLGGHIKAVDEKVQKQEMVRLGWGFILL